MIGINKNSIIYKFSLSISILLIVILVALVTTNFFVTRERLYNRLELQSKVMLDGIEYSIDGYLASDKIGPVQKLISNFGTTDEIHSISLINRDHIILADTEPSHVGERLDTPLITNTLDTEKSMSEYSTKNGVKLFTLTRPLKVKEYSINQHMSVSAVISLTMNTSVIDKKIMSDLKYNLLLMTLIALIIFVINIYISRKLLITPLKSLGKYTKSIAGGDFSVRIPSSLREYEIEQIISDLNIMTEHLSALSVNLSNSNRYLETIYTSMGGMFFITDNNGIINKINNTTSTSLGYDGDEMIGHSIRDYLFNDGNDVPVEFEKTAQPVKMRFRKNDGSYISALTTITPFEDNDNNSNYDIIFIAQNLTEYKILEERVNDAKEAIIISRYAGMSEIATNVLHNIGNVLNSVNVSSSTIKSLLLGSQLVNLKRVSTLLKEHSPDINTYLTADPKGKLIPAYIQELTSQWVSEHRLILEECESLVKSVDHIKDIVKMQQSFTGSYGVIEPIHLGETIDDAIKMTLIDFTTRKIKIIKDYHDDELVHTDKVKILQIFINLIKNASEALLSYPEIDKEIKISIHRIDQNIVEVTVTDNGIGILPKNLAKIFTFGFTTKKSGHGHGLHSCTYIAKELLGTLEVSSKGLNRGTTFTLHIPYQIVK